MIRIITESMSPELPVSWIWIIAISSLLLPTAFYVLRSIGLYVMAKRQGFEKAYLAWIPCVWIFIACKLIGKVKIFGSTFEKLALIFFIILTISEVLTLAYNFLIYFPLVGNFLMGRDIWILAITDTTEAAKYTKGLNAFWGKENVYVDASFVDPYGAGVYTVINICNIISIISFVFDIAVLVISIMAYINLFKKYMPQHYILASVLSIFGAFGPCVFVARKKEPIDYETYIRSRYTYFYGGNGQHNPYANPYNSPYNHGGQPMQPTRPTPFEEFAEKGEAEPGNPFEEFYTKKDDRN